MTNPAISVTRLLSGTNCPTYTVMIGSMDMVASMSISAVSSIANTGRRSGIIVQALPLAALRSARRRMMSCLSSWMRVLVARKARKMMAPAA